MVTSSKSEPNPMFWHVTQELSPCVTGEGSSPTDEGTEVQLEPPRDLFAVEMARRR